MNPQSGRSFLSFSRIFWRNVYTYIRFTFSAFPEAQISTSNVDHTFNVWDHRKYLFPFPTSSLTTRSLSTIAAFSIPFHPSILCACQTSCYPRPMRFIRMIKTSKWPIYLLFRANRSGRFLCQLFLPIKTICFSCLPAELKS